MSGTRRSMVLHGYPSICEGRSAVSASGIEYETFRKPQCTFDYVPRSSAHALGVGHSLVAGELRRLLITNSRRTSWERQVLIFRKKLTQRGYNLGDFQRHFAALNWSQKRPILGKGRRNRSTEGCLFLRAKFVRGSKLGALTKCLNKAAKVHLGPIFQKRGRAAPEFRVATSVGRNLFRQVYKLTW